MGENKKLEENTLNPNKHINFEYREAGTSLQNGEAEQAFEILYGRFRAMMNEANFYRKLREKLWAECAMTLTLLDGILINRKGEK